MSNKMAIFQDVDKCMRCRGCVLSCKRTWKMKADDPGEHKVAPDSRVIIKSQKRVDNGPFIRFSCWHCSKPPCAGRCPFGAIKKQANGAVSVDPDLCNPGGTNSRGIKCIKQCETDCNRAGYPKIGDGSTLFATSKAWKCTMCFGRAGSDADIAAATSQRGVAYGTPLPANGNQVPTIAGRPDTGPIAEMDHEPSCVYTCPAKAMKWDTVANIKHYMNNRPDPDDPTKLYYKSAQGDSNVFWASRAAVLIQPKADPYIEDHITPMMSNLLNGPFAKAAIVPTLLAGGLLAVIARRQANMEETVGMREG